MNLGLILITFGVALVVVAIIYLLFRINSPQNRKGTPGSGDQDPYNVKAAEAVNTIFDEAFREELKNRGRLHFEKIIGENAMFLQQDLQITTSQLNEYMKQEITTKLQSEFSKYEQSIMDAKELAIQSISKTQAAIEEQRQMLSKEIAEQLAKDKAHLIKTFENNLSLIVNHYLLEAIGNQIDLSDQLEFILNDLESNKDAILKDINDGA